MVLQSLNLAVAFLLELCMLAALADWGAHAGRTTPVKNLLAVGTPLLAALIWGVFLAPSSSARLQGLAYLALKTVLFGLAAVGLALAGHITLAIVFAVVSVINQVLLLVWRQDTRKPVVE